MWVVGLVLIHPFAGNLYRVTDDSAAANLPKSAQSTQVAELLDGGHSRQSHDTVAVVFTGRTAMSSTEAVQVSASRRAVAGLVGTVEGLGSPGAIERSLDGRAAVFTAPVTAPHLQRSGVDTRAVRAIRAAVGTGAEPGTGAEVRSALSVAVTGSAAVTADQGNTSQTTLLLTALLIVGAVLILTYRSAVLWLLPVVGALAGIVIAQAATHLLGEKLVTVSSLSTSILIVLVFGAASDYALLLIHRYRDELARHELAEEAMASALRTTVPTLLASGGTVIGAMMCLLAARSAALSGLGPVGAVSIASALLAQLTFLPAMLLVVGRRGFWPKVPAVSAQPRESMWSRLAGLVQQRPAPIVIVGGLLLAAACVGITSIHLDNDPLANVRGTSESVNGATSVRDHFGPGSGSPLIVLVPTASARQAASAVARMPAVRAVTLTRTTRNRDEVSATLRMDPYSPAGRAAVHDVRRAVDRVVPSALVGGDAAIGADTTSAARRDAAVLIPLIFLVVLLIVGVLLRAVVAPLALVITTALSFGASLGISVFLWRFVLGLEGVEAQLPMYLFVFLIALGIDYNIFLAARIREESRFVGTAEGTRRGLAATGGVITAAGVVLAGTFLALASSPRVDLTEVGTAIAIGVLVDTLLVRTVVVPAIFFAVGPRAWWPASSGKR